MSSDFLERLAMEIQGMGLPCLQILVSLNMTCGNVIPRSACILHVRLWHLEGPFGTLMLGTLQGLLGTLKARLALYKICLAPCKVHGRSAFIQWQFFVQPFRQPHLSSSKQTSATGGIVIHRGFQLQSSSLFFMAPVLWWWKVSLWSNVLAPKVRCLVDSSL